MYFLLNILFIGVSVLYMATEARIVDGHRKYIYWFFVITASVLFAFRPNDTKDTIAYINGFLHSSDMSVENVTLFQKYKGYEIGYIFLMRVFRFFSDSYRLFFFLVAFSGLSLTLYSLSRITIAFDNEDAELCEGLYIPSGRVLAIYIATYGFLYHGITVRAGLSIGLMLFAITRIQDAKYIEAVFFVVLAFSVHRMSFLILFGYLIQHYLPTIRQKTHIVIWTVLGFFMFSGIASMLFRHFVFWLNYAITHLGISGYSAYLNSLDIGVGLSDVYKWSGERRP